MFMLLLCGVFMFMLGFLAFFDEQEWAFYCEWIGIAIIWGNVLII